MYPQKAKKRRREQQLARLKEYIQHREPVAIQVEDDRTGMDLATLQRAFTNHLYYNQGKDRRFATLHDYYMALSRAVRDRLVQRRIATAQTYFEQDPKVVYYLSLEFLMGRQLSNNLVNVGLYEKARQMLQGAGLDLDDLIDQEAEPGLGNGGLGRLAACFLDSLATLEIPAIGYGIRYEFGIFHQAIQDGWQVEHPDKWLSFGNPWEMPRPDYRVEVKFGGRTLHYHDGEGRYRVTWIPEHTVLGTPYDVLVPGYHTNTVNTLRLWKAVASEEFDFQAFNAGDYIRAVADKTQSESISKVLYPNDNTPQGRRLRLEQQYFFVACALQDILRLYRRQHESFEAFSDKVAIQLNDTHPALAIAELMRLLIDESDLPWEQAWSITQNTFAYTNHTLLPESLERWPVSLLGRLLPRHLEIIYEINQRFLAQVEARYPGNDALAAQLSLIQEGPEKQVRMAHLACVGSHSINGVAELHSRLLREELLAGFYDLWPEKFSNKTNGVTPRRWLLLSNPRLAYLITEKLGRQWITHLDDLRRLENWADDPDFQHRWHQIKQDNKRDLAAYIAYHNGLEVDPESLFDIQVKRIHEYKRQVLNLLYILTLHQRLQRDPALDIVPRTFIFAGKAAPGYAMAKLIIKLITAVADQVNADPKVAGRLKVVFLADYSVSLGQLVYPAADLSEQISTAGKEASGTGNMKFAMNGALTIGTLDGANIEIRQAVGAENFFLFGLTAEQVAGLDHRGYAPMHYVHTHPELEAVLQSLMLGHYSPHQPHLFQPLMDTLLYRDEYKVLADYQAYLTCQEQVDRAFRDRPRWTRMSILNTARMGPFSSDRTIQDYARDIWAVQPVPIQLPPNLARAEPDPDRNGSQPEVKPAW
ncbi:MAG TPA: glycogen/starch/alpha-glucan phosphorylase [Leptolyngbyaceae cyanobacterium M65_K2018_010]|nr:glycogen/starch/alpha-glucan phosphorylase [Leptolyngbyaceae cyanobacterium M65_K2018_010]